MLHIFHGHRLSFIVLIGWVLLTMRACQWADARGESGGRREESGVLWRAQLRAERYGQKFISQYFIRAGRRVQLQVEEQRYAT